MRHLNIGLRALAPSSLFSVAVLVLAACSSSSSVNDSGTKNDGGASGDASTGDAGASGDCSVTSTGSAGLLIQGQILLPSGPASGEVLVDGSGKIVCADVSCASSSGYGAATVLSCPGGVVSAGLVNAHDHTDYNTAPPIAHGTTRWDHRNGWRTGTGGEPTLKEPSTSSDAKVLAAAEMRFLMSGVTTLNGSGGVDGLVRNVANYKNQEQLEGLTGKTVHFDTFPLGDSNGTEVPSGGCTGYPSVTSASQAFEDGNYTPHIAEGINSDAENEFTCLKATVVTSRTGIIHGVGTNATDVATIATAGAKLIWSPRSNISLYGDTAPVTEYKEAGVVIGMGTDWLASGSMNMLRELACADSMNQKYFAQKFSDQDLYEMATKNGAIALGFDSQIGTLSAGLVADIAIYAPGTNSGYRAVIAAGVEDVLLVLRGGKPLYGRQSIIDGLGGGCENFTVCGQQQEACIDTPSVKLADVQSAASASYPLFFCKDATPDAEPTCVPYRDSYPNGTSATDQDGDGIADSSDDCPTIFNPPRTMDASDKQSDVDGDGVGDVCDAAPLDNTKH
jgi:cytosine/adenosine deaminase-related metal-dependent hydrolase